MLEIGSLVDGKYRVLNKCGQGGMSVVYMAINERANKTWAIKEVRKDGVQDYDVVKQGLIVETDLLKRLSHPNLPSIVDVIDGDGSFLIVMDYIEGKTLKDVLAEYGPQPQESVIDWAKQLCDVLGYLHSRQPAIIYRDMKPSNVMLKPDGSIVLFDFGTAREYKISSMEDTTCLGTRGYAAPEQYGGHGQTDPRTDIYCLGATMYHLLTGHNPSEPPYEMYPIRQWNPNLSAGLETIILKCTQKNPADRYQSCAELLYDLEHYREVDITFGNEQRAKFRRFVVPAVLAVVCGIGALAFHFLEGSELTSTYEYYISSAEKASGDTKIGYYRSAINLEPTNEEAWMALLEEFLSDDTFTSSESETLQSILLTNESSFESNVSGYDEFCYEAGIAYYYKLETGNGKSQAKHYFEIAKDSEYLSEQQIARAERLYEISDYYSKLGVLDNTGDATVSYLEYWSDLTALSSGNLVEVDNASTALIMYRELAGQIVSHASDFKDAGVTEEQMLEQIENMEEHLETDFDTAGLTAQQQESMANLESAISQARTVINSTYSTVGE
ncbi:MAG: serine/threonine protein kinase [Clostridiales bacterium]|nr:serine/threonine protein kinase [Clostridiales bacterium]